MHGSVTPGASFLPGRGQGADPLDEALFDALPDPVLITDGSGAVLALNQAARVLIADPGANGRVAIGDLLPFVDLDSGPTGAADTWQGHVAAPDGQERDVEVVRRKVSGGDRDTRCVFLVHDVSHYMELTRSREALLHGAAHELRNPVMALQNVLDLLATGGATLTAQEFKHLLDVAARTAQRLAELTEGLLNAATIRTGNLQVVLEACALKTLVDVALDSVSLMIEARSQRVERGPDAGLWVLADRRFGPRVVANLLANASKYSPQGATIRVQTEARGTEVLVQVEDQGPGIPPEQIDGMFERYYRARPAEEDPGIGLGLAIARGIVEAQGGEIGVRSELGKGTTVWFTLRATSGAAPQGDSLR